MRLFFVRHCQSANNAVQLDDSSRWTGRVPDPALTISGHDQGIAVASYLKEKTQLFNVSFTAILTSPMLRALETAQYIHKDFPDVPVHAVGDLVEVGGLFEGPRSEAKSSEIIEGSTFEELREKFPFLNKCYSATNSKGAGWWGKGRETASDAVRRAFSVAKGLWKYARLWPDSVVCLVTHGLFQDLLVKALITDSMRGGPTAGPPAFLPSLEQPEDVGECDHNNNEKNGSLDFLNILQPAVNDPHLLRDGFYFLCNNTGISLLELLVTQKGSSQKKNQLDAGVVPASPVTEGSAKHRLAILWWNSHDHLNKDILKASGHSMCGFSLF